MNWRTRLIFLILAGFIGLDVIAQDIDDDDSSAESTNPFFEMLELTEPMKENPEADEDTSSSQPLPGLESGSEQPDPGAEPSQESKSDDSDPPPITKAELDRVRVIPFDLRAPSIGFTTLSFKYVLQVSNPGDRPVKTPVLAYEGFIGDVFIGIGQTYFPDIPAGGHRRYESAFIVSYTDLGHSLVELIRGGEFSLRLEGTLSSEGVESGFATTLQVEREALP